MSILSNAVSSAASQVNSAASSAASQIGTTASNALSSLTGTTSSTTSTGSTGSTAPTGSQTACRQFRYVSSAPDHAAAEPGPASSARHQSVHPTTGRVRLGRAAGQHEHQPANADLDAADLGGDVGAATCRLTVTVSGNAAALSNATNSAADLEPQLLRRRRPAQSPSPARRADRLHRNGVAQRRNAELQLERPGQQRPDLAGRQLHAWRSTRPAPTARRSRCRTQVQGTVTAVNISQNPPTLTVSGQNYPISQIQSLSNSSTLSSLSSSISNLNTSISSLSQIL